MRKLIYLMLLVMGCLAVANAAPPQGYYNAMNGKQKEALKAAAKTCVQTHKKLNYTALPDYWQYFDVYPELYNGSKRWWEMYSNNVFLIRSGQSGTSSFSANRMQREHSIPKSWWKKNGDVEYTPAYTDLWNLYPSDGPANQAKLNYPFGICKSTTFDNGVSKVGPAQTGYGGGSGIVFEPGDEYKGDFARSIFYMAVVYDDLPWVYNYMFTTQEYPTLRGWAIDMLLDWSRRDPVDEKEITRNSGVENAQGNRNPFIDFPELAEYIWGTRMNEVFYLSNQDDPTPPITGDPEITAPIDGQALDFSQVAIGQSTAAQLHVTGSNLTADLSVRITGTDRAMFTVSTNTIPAREINQGHSYLLNILYKPTSEGEHTANLTLYDGGLPLGQQINVQLMGQAFPVPQLDRLVARDATDITATSYTANWDVSPQVVDYYVVNRVRYDGDNVETEQLDSPTNSLDITDRDASVTETYTVCASRLGFLSEASNSITVSAGTGVAGITADQPLTIGSMEGGFVVMLDTEHTNLAVYDMTGREVYHAASVTGGEMVYLPAGIYLVLTDQDRRPKKIIVK